MLEAFAAAHPPGGPATPPVSSVGMAGELAKLAGLHTDGVLIDDEFAAAKTKLLG